LIHQLVIHYRGVATVLVALQQEYGYSCHPTCWGLATVA
jgi:hypothetical protein